MGTERKEGEEGARVRIIRNTISSKLEGGPSQWPAYCVCASRRAPLDYKSVFLFDIDMLNRSSKIEILSKTQVITPGMSKSLPILQEHRMEHNWYHSGSYNFSMKKHLPAQQC